VLFVGSSSIRFWFGLKEAMHPVPVIRRGFGGAKLSDVTYYASRIVLPYKPRAIVLFAGTNDIRGSAHDKTPYQLLVDFKALVALIERQLPGTPLYYVSITPTTSRWRVWPQIQKANGLIAAYARSRPHVHFIDATPFLLTREGVPNRELLWWDGVHLNRQGYKQWGDLIRSRLLEDLYAPARFGRQLPRSKARR
jgi:lysophospholipase L1-like esterase